MPYRFLQRILSLLGTLQSWGKITVIPERNKSHRSISLPVGDSPHGAGGAETLSSSKLFWPPGFFVLCRDGSLVTQWCCLACSLQGWALLVPPRGVELSDRVFFTATSPTARPVWVRKKCIGGKCVPADPKPEHFSQKIKIQRKKIVGESEWLCAACRCEDKCFHWKWTFK